MKTEEEKRRDWPHETATGVTNPVWKYFKVYPKSKKFDGCVCKICFDKFKDVAKVRPSKWEVMYGNGATSARAGYKSTSKLSSHLQHNHPEIIKRIQDAEVAESLIKVGPMNKFVKSEYSLKEENFAYYMLKLLVQNFIPFCFVENPDFRKILDFASNRKVEHVSSEYIIEKMHEKAIEIEIGAKTMLEGQHVAFTTDSWTSSDNHESYVAFVAHWIDDEFVLKSTALKCVHFPAESHITTELMASKIVGFIADFNISAKNVVCLVTDHKPTMNALITNHLPYDWMGCFHHFMEVMTGVMLNADKQIMSNARTIVTHFTHSLQSQKELASLQHELYPDKKPLCLIDQEDVSTRYWWRSTWQMCDRLYKLKIPLQTMHGNEDITVHLQEKEWEHIHHVQAILEPFVEIEQVLEDDKAVTISWIPYMVFRMRDHLKTKLTEYTEQKNIVIVNCITTMIEMLNMKFGGENGDSSVIEEHLTHGYNRQGIPHVVLIACAIDPRTKNLAGIPVDEHSKVWDMVRAELQRIHEELYPPQEGTLTSELKNDTVSAHIGKKEEDNKKRGFFNIEEFDIDMDDDTSTIPSTSSSVSATNMTVGGAIMSVTAAEMAADDELSYFIRNISRKAHTSIAPFDPLKWYHDNEKRFPLLSILARRVLCVPATTSFAASSVERAFSSSTTAQGNKLSVENVQALVVLHKTWDLVESYQQKIKILFPFEDDDEEDCRRSKLSNKKQRTNCN